MRVRCVLAGFLALILFQSLSGCCSDLALVHAKIYPSPTQPPIEDGAILVHEGRIVGVGPSAKIKVPREATVVDCKGLVVTAGFWNSHVHILTPGLLHAERLSSEQITSQLQAMLKRWGFTTVFDSASVLENTTLIRRRIESGEVRGPRILTVGGAVLDERWNAYLCEAIPRIQSHHIPEVPQSATDLLVPQK